ncbi:proline-rich protein 33 isoform X2 [Hyla sarda]|uniref:proline-rich protein 33 isoform X2 n=1 Tax=Hyla sarda TaxID=327740 RepID=UPI0024C262EB|nr:proline-rich protein 33 isoform X2 [Hyla sarda]
MGSIMLLTVTPLENPGPPSPAPPPTPPKPRKDNAKLQKLLRKAAKRSGAQSSPTLTTKSFRSTLSPVSEGDLESLESAAPQKNKKPPPINLPPRFQLKGVTHRAPSPYPKQFTFTVSEQQSLSQYLSPSPVPDTPSPRPFRCSSPNIQFLYPQGGNTPDGLSPRVIANSSPRPCTPQAIEISPTQPLVSHLHVLPSPAIVIHEADGNNTGSLSLNINETINKAHIDGFSALTCEDIKLSQGPSFPRSIPDQQESSHKPTGSSTLENVPIKPVSTSSKVTDTKKIVHNVSRVVEIPQIVTANDTRTTSVNQALTTVNSTDNPDGQSKVTVNTVSVEVTISSKSTGASLVTSSTDLPEIVSKTEESTILKPPEKPKPPRKKPGGGWARLVKHLVVEPEEPTFLELQKAEDKTEKSVGEKKAATEGTQQSKTNRANKMWDALLYHMGTKNKEQENPGSTAPPPLPFFRSRLPLLLHRPRFDARKLKEAASRPLRRVTAFFHRRIAEKEASSTSSTFNRTASGWSIRGEDVEKEDEKNAVAGDMKQ